MSNMQLRLRQEYDATNTYSRDDEEELFFELENGRNILAELRLEQEEA